MPTSRKPRNTLRSCKLAVRLLPEQRRKVRRSARRDGITVSAYVTRLIDGSARKRPAAGAPPAEIVPLPLLAHWQRTGNNINQIARALHRGRHASAEWIVEAMREMLLLMIEDQLTRRIAMKCGAAGIRSRLA